MQCKPISKLDIDNQCLENTSATYTAASPEVKDADSKAGILESSRDTISSIPNGYISQWLHDGAFLPTFTFRLLCCVFWHLES